ncbi:MAG: CesT family type III secretion system chaperone [Desulfobacter sp.]|nr:MAG: CesT family type III secretion system chaperone [Desulfobacter sp.]
MRPIEIPGDRESLLVLFGRALSLNLFLIETRGTTIAFAEEIGQIMLCFMQEKQVCNAQKFASLIEGFHQTAIDIRRKLEAFSQEETIGVSAPPPLVDFV